MSIRVGTLVIRRDQWEDFPCQEYNPIHPDIPYKLNVCVGMVQLIEDDPNYHGPDEWDHVALSVHWMTQCPYHRSVRESHERVTIGEVHEVGQLD